MVAVAAAVAIALFGCSNGDTETPTPTSEPATGVPGSAGTPVDAAGTFIYEGKRLTPPFDVTSNGRSVIVNGETVLTLGGVVPDAPGLDAPIESAFGLADHAAAAYEAAGAGPGALEAARDAIAGEPLLAAAVVDDEANELAITDTDGLQVFFRPDPADGAVRARSDGEIEADAAQQATEWATFLDAGGLVLVPAEGPTLMVGGGAAAELVESIDEAMSLVGAAREEALLELLPHESVVAELIANYEPDAQSRRLTPDRFSRQRGRSDRGSAARSHRLPASTERR